jgi:hypothetical protein
MMNYTEGPWTWEANSVFKDEHRNPIASVYDPEYPNRLTNIAAANAQLIAAAPDMYEALKEVEYSAVLDLDGDYISCCPICDVWAGEKHKDYCEIGNALKKAEGKEEE